jgi:hypothetical protein
MSLVGVSRFHVSFLSITSNQLVHGDTAVARKEEKREGKREKTKREGKED